MLVFRAQNFRFVLGSCCNFLRLRIGCIKRFLRLSANFVRLRFGFFPDVLCLYFRALFDDFCICLSITHSIGIYIYWKCFTSVISLLLRFGFRFNSIAITDIFQNLTFLVTPFIECRNSISVTHEGECSLESQLLLRTFLISLANRHEINVQVRSSVPLVIVHNRAGYCKIRIAFLERRELEIGFNIRSANLFKA